jgi:hypothetical protein
MRARRAASALSAGSALAPILHLTPGKVTGEGAMANDGGSKERQARKRKREKFVGSVRQSDIEPYTGLRWVGTLFKAAAVFLLVAVVGEFIAGLRFHGTEALAELLGQLARTTVLAVVLWGGGDLVRLLIQLGNDVRADRILLSRLVHRTPAVPGDQQHAAVADEALDAASLVEAEDEALA